MTCLLELDLIWFMHLKIVLEYKEYGGVYFMVDYTRVNSEFHTLVCPNRVYERAATVFVINRPILRISLKLKVLHTFHLLAYQKMLIQRYEREFWPPRIIVRQHYNLRGYGLTVIAT